MIEIALASDANYVCGLLVTAVTLARHASPSVSLRFNVLDGGIPDVAWNDFEAKVHAVHANSVFRRLPVGDARFAAFPEWNGRSRLTYARLLLPMLLADADWVLYCDVDFLWCADVSELWSLRAPHALVLTTPDGTDSCRSLEEPWFHARGLPYACDGYFCAGLLMMNLAQWRRLDVAGRVLAFLDAHPDVQFADQSALNAVLGAAPLAPDVENVKMLPAKWQKMSRFVTADDIRRGCVLHYAGDTPWRRAWRTQPLTDLQLIWHAVHGALTGLDQRGSLCRFFPARDRVLRRTLFHLAATPVARNLLFLVLRLTGRRGYVTWMKGCCRRFPVDELARRLMGGADA